MAFHRVPAAVLRWLLPHQQATTGNGRLVLPASAMGSLLRSRSLSYTACAERLQVARDSHLKNRPLTATEKILYSHLHDPTQEVSDPHCENMVVGCLEATSNEFCYGKRLMGRSMGLPNRVEGKGGGWGAGGGVNL